MKIDLGELDRKAREALKKTPADHWHLVASDGALIGSPEHENIAANAPPVTIALIAYITQLEALAVKHAEYLDSDGYYDQRDRVRALLEKGAVLP